MIFKSILSAVLLVFLTSFCCSAQTVPGKRLKMDFMVSMDNPSSHTFQVELLCSGLEEMQVTDFKIPSWMPGYYQIINYADDIQNLKVYDQKNKPIKWEKANHNTWRIYNDKTSKIKLTYDVRATKSFVANNFINEERAFIAPTGLFLHVNHQINTPVNLQIKPYKSWNKIATGLEKVAGKPFTYHAQDFDVLYDSPILIGQLEELPAFTVKGIPHYFIGFRLGDFNKADFINDLKKALETAVSIIGEVPFKEYTFIGIGPGGGGIEHLNSTAVAFTGSKAYDTPQGRRSTLSFLVHEYFHHYNAKRIRPIELGPFDYDNGSRTNMLWVAEGVTTYYDEMLLRWSGLGTEDDILKSFQTSIKSYENSPGRFFQSVSQASYDTWSDGPFGRTGDEVNKTISYYEKGPVLAMMLDIKIRHETQNKKSLDDVMRILYYDYYKKQNRGYTEQEFKRVCEATAGITLDEFFNYIYTVTTPDYSKYLDYAGLTIDLIPKPVAGSGLGIKATVKNDTLIVRDVDWQSPAWIEGIRRNQVIATINGEKASVALLNSIPKQFKDGEIVKLEVIINGTRKLVPLILATKLETSFEIKKKTSLTPLQEKIAKAWLRGAP